MRPSQLTHQPHRAHPRRCGEHAKGVHDMDDKEGSSPQVRGTLGRGAVHDEDQGLIPAGAGNIAAGRTTTAPTRAHPRRCGEHSITRGTGDLDRGSSPQVRGTSTGIVVVLRSGGLIPAGAGNIRAKRSAAPPSQAHPRRCGEHRGDDFDGAHGVRLIPAGAGNIPSSPPRPAPRGAHPRRCGEHWVIDVYDARMLGSSPQVRGTFIGLLGGGGDVGLIPAGAGNMPPPSTRRL